VQQSVSDDGCIHDHASLPLCCDGPLSPTNIASTSSLS
jgi:hypothetical protein